MRFINDKEKALIVETGKKAWGRIDAEQLSPTPENYELWFTYFARSSVEVVRAVDAMIDEKKISDAMCADIYERFLSDLRNEEKVRRAGEEIQTTIKDVSNVVETVRSAAHNYSTTLDEVAEKITAVKTPEDMKTFIDKVKTDTSQMAERNKTLEDALSKSTLLMEELQRDLEFVRREALTDGLTGLANRKSFDSDLEQVITDAKATGSTFTLVMVDIDYFKSFNDNYGHQVGDQVLRLVARTLKDGVKGRDIAARYGGEEFAIVLPDTDLSAGVAVGNSLRRAIAMKDVVNRSTGDVLGRITMSAGVAEYIKGEKMEDLIERADAALYTAKHNGRNQVAAAPSPNKAR